MVRIIKGKRMKRNIFLATVMTCMCVSAIASADPLFKGEHPLRLGGSLDFGVPSGVALSAVVHPKEDYLVPSVGLTYNGLSFGGRLALRFDPLALKPRIPIGLFLDLQGGIVGQGTIPGHSDLPSVGYDYINCYGGLRLGTPNGFQWDFEVGPSYIAAHTGNFQSVISNSTPGLTVSNPSVSGWIAPTFITGFSVVWP